MSFWSAFAGVLVFGMYLWTMAPGLSFIDAGELSTVASTLGIAHPTGYPLFTLFARMFSMLPFGKPIENLNLMAAFCCAVGVMVFVHLSWSLLSRNHAAGKTRSVVLISSVSAALLLAFSVTYWSQATAIEVYPLHCVLLGLVIQAFLSAAWENRLDQWILFAFILGLSFTNHLTTVLLAPAFLFYYFASQGFGIASWKRIGIMVLPFLFGLSPYLYLPLRAARAPLMNWGNPISLERLFWHVSGKQYHNWMFSSSDVAVRQFRGFVDSFPQEFVYLGVVLALLGIWVLWRSDRRLLVFTMLLFVGCLAYAINYDIHDIDSYFLLAYFTTALWIGFGLRQIGLYLVKNFQRGVAYSGIIGALAVAFVAGANFSTVNERQDHLVDDYIENMFASLPPNALIISYQWDNWVSASFYKQLVEGERPDVTVIDKELLRRSWYLTQLERTNSKLVAESRREVDAFLREVDKFEHDEPYNQVIIESRYAGMIRSFIVHGLRERPVFVTSEIEPQYTAGFQRVPMGLALRLYPDTLSHPSPFPRFVVRPPVRNGRLEDQTFRLYSQALVLRGDYCLLKLEDRGEARRSYEAALQFQPGERGILQRLAVSSDSSASLPRLRGF